MSRRLDAGDIDFAELLNVVKHLTQLLGELCFFVRRERESRQRRDVVDVELGGGGHG